MLATETVYDNMSGAKVDSGKRKILSFPMGNGEGRAWEEPKARIQTKMGDLAPHNRPLHTKTRYDPHV